ncbi:MAG: excinuclease ABC subunit UvrB [Candidatus Taylorbacteria bacterium]|nr:excinuclease ABC subunit UvrB [Candidatus Taylorbacteria bacterium]
MKNDVFKLNSDYQPAGDQPKAIESLIEGVKAGDRYETLLGVTGSGKTFTMANVIKAIGKPALVIAHNKTLAAQLAQEYRDFFPNNAVHYFVSYYDYYQPEAYIPHSDTYIEKEAQINAEIERLRHASTQALLSRRDVIIVASVSCIYGLGSPEEYEKVNLKIWKGMRMNRGELIRSLVHIYFKRTTADLTPGVFRAIGNVVEVMPVHEKVVYRIGLEDDKINHIDFIDPISRAIRSADVEALFIFPAKHFVTPLDDRLRAIEAIKEELAAQLPKLQKEGKALEAERLKRRTNYDLALIREIGYCNGIENYSRHFSGKSAGEPPDTLLSYFPRKADGTADFLTIIDESHVTVPQLNGMLAGDKSRKQTLVDHGFRLPSAKDNRPLSFEEFGKRVGQVIFTSATPSHYEIEVSSKVVEQIIRPTGLIDPELIVRPVVGKGKYKGQVADFISEAEAVIKKGQRVMATTLTKKMAEDLSEYLKDKGIKTEYLHSDVETLDRITRLTDFRKGKYECLVGVNLLREGLDLPEVTLIGIFDADKEGFLRSETSLIQTIGRAARNAEGRVILYADKVTGSLEKAINETNRRRDRQIAHNKEHGITPKTIMKRIADITETLESEREKTVRSLLALDGETNPRNKKKLITDKLKQMNEAVKELDFETAAILRDEIRYLTGKIIR